MALPTHFKRRRWTLALCLGLAPSPLWAAAADWNCTRGKDDKQWVCDARKPGAPDTGAAPAEKPAPAPAPRARTAPAEPVPDRRETARPAEPAPPPREPIRPAEAAPPETEPQAPAGAATPARSEPPARTGELLAEPKTPEVAEPPSSPKAPAKAEAPRPSVEPSAAEAPRPAPARPSGPATAAELKRVPEAVDIGSSAAAKPAAVPAASASRSGWSCTAGEADDSGKGWNCTLEGTDPQGMAHEVGEGTTAASAAGWAESKEITGQDEQRFGKLMSLLPANPWQNVCTAAITGIRKKQPPMSEFVLSAADREARDRAPMEIRSDYFEMLDSEVANFSGGAEMVKADQRLWGDYVTRNLLTNAVNARGRVVYQEKGFALSSDTGFMDADTSRGVFRNSQFILPSVPARGTSRLTHVDSSTLSRYENFSYTACPPGDQDWVMHASNVKINRETGVGSARNAWLEFKDVPVFYSPYMSFPTDDRRMSGFLSPSWAFTKVGGFDFSVPYYFNLAPNYDYTARPRYLTNRGFLLRNEFRYLTEMTRGRIAGDIMPHDDETGTMRGQVGVLNSTRFSKNLTAFVDANYVSDERYLNELGSPLNLVDRRNIRSIGYVTYTGTNYSVRSQIDYFQTIDPSIPPEGRPYFHLPQIVFNYFNTIPYTGLQFDGQVQFDAFDTSGINKTVGQRLKLRPKLSYPIQSAAGFITPSFTLLHNEYWLQDPQYWTQTQQALWAPFGGYKEGKTGDSESLTVPIFSLDSGAFFDRDFQWGTTPMLQTLEPRLFYVYIPNVNQDSIPVFDSSPYDFTYYQLFRENRFTGSDRVGDANEVTAALTTRLVDQTSGQERLRASLGNIFYFDDRQVTLGGPPPETQRESYSNLVSEVFAGLSENWSIRAGGQYNPERDQIDRGLVALQYNNRKNEILNLAYRYRRNQYTLDCIKGDPNNGCLDLTDVSFRLPIAEGWHAIGRWQYSLQDQVTLESFLGIERETCCWRFTLLGRHYINNLQPGTNQNQSNNGIFVQLELKGLTRLGDQVDLFLQRSISGYRFRENF